MEKVLNCKITDMLKWCNNLNGEMVKFLQWGFGEMSKCNGVLFLPNSTPLLPIFGCINWVRVRFSP